MNAEDGAAESSQVRVTPFGTLTVFLKDVPGIDGGKAGTSQMEWADPPPRPIKLKKKYRHKG